MEQMIQPAAGQQRGKRGVDVRVGDGGDEELASGHNER